MISRKLRFALLTAGLALVATACGTGELPQDTFDPEGPVARQLDRLIQPVFLVAAIFFVVVEGLILYVVFRFRQRSDDDAPKQVHGNARLELGWTIVPAAILAVVGALTLGTILDIHERPGDGALAVRVIGHQWWWEYEYPDHGVTTANELHIPVGRKIDVSMTSEDVIHSFWPPKLAGKVDVIPGRVNHMVIEAEKPGVYHGQCAEFCGLSHANMKLRVVAHEPADFERWLQSNRATPAVPSQSDGAAFAGAQLFRQKGCASCHAVRGFAAGEVGPDLTHLQQREVFAGAMFELNEQNMRRWLKDPPGEKPGSIMPNLNLTDDEITNLIAYLNTLK